MHHTCSFFAQGLDSRIANLIIGNYRIQEAKIILVHPKCVLIGAIKIFIFPIKSDNHMGSNTEKRL